MDRRASQDWIEIARTIVEAKHLRKNRWTALVDSFDVDVITAKQLLREARVRGLLGLGEHRPATAMVLRGTTQGREWMVCTRCTDRWPCAVAREHAEAYVARMPHGGEGITPNEHGSTP